LATNTRNGSGRRQNRSESKPTDKKDLALSDAQFWRLSTLQKDVELCEQSLKINDRDSEISKLRRRIHELEHALMLEKQNILKVKKQKTELFLTEYRAQLAKDLGLQSLDSYIVDTDSFKLIHEGEI